MTDRLSEIIREFEAKGFRRLPTPNIGSSLYPDSLFQRLSTHAFSWIYYQTLEGLAIKKRRLPLVFYTSNGQIEDLGIQPFPPKWLPENYIGMSFKKHREKLGLKPKDVAYKSSCTVEKYLEYESGKSKPNTYAADRISNVLGLLPVYLPDFPAKPPKEEKDIPKNGQYINKIFGPVIEALEYYRSHQLHPHTKGVIQRYVQRIIELTKS